LARNAVDNLDASILTACRHLETLLAELKDISLQLALDSIKNSRRSAVKLSAFVRDVEGNRARSRFQLSLCLNLLLPPFIVPGIDPNIFACLVRKLGLSGLQQAINLGDVSLLFFYGV
jgi:hypothetical protein